MLVPILIVAAALWACMTLVVLALCVAAAGGDHHLRSADDHPVQT
jgi:hypothetical protein